MHRRILILVMALAGCPSSKDEAPAETPPDTQAVTQQFSAPKAIITKHEDTEIAWTVDEAGKVKAGVRTGGKVVTSGLAGQLFWKDASGDRHIVPMKLDDKTGLLEAEAPDATSLDYELTVKGQPVEGALAIREPAPTSEPAPPPPPATTTTPPRPASPTPPTSPSRRKEESGRFPPRR